MVDNQKFDKEREQGKSDDLQNHKTVSCTAARLSCD